jgi:chromosomal replication initiation ATPase DnaA
MSPADSNPRPSRSKFLPSQMRYRARDLAITASNIDAFALLTKARQWPGRVVALRGEEGAGKTHMAMVWAKANNAVVIPPKSTATFALRGLKAATGWGLIDDADQIDDPTMLFNVLNHVAAEGTALLLTGRGPPSSWPSQTLGDVGSRLRAIPSVELLPPDDELLGRVLINMARERYIDLDVSHVHYLVLRMERSFRSAREIVSMIDAALDRGAPSVTRDVVREALRRSEMELSVTQEET